MRLNPVLIAAAFLAIPLAAQPAPPATAPDPADAWPFYEKAVERVAESLKLHKAGPTRADVAFGRYPPFGGLWEKTAKDAIDFNASALEAVHPASPFKVAQWP